MFAIGGKFNHFKAICNTTFYRNFCFTLSLHLNSILIMHQQEYKVDIPELFYSDAEGKPFELCQVCGKDLLGGNTVYVVEKAFKSYKGYDFKTTLFEYAICLDCHMEIQNRMSEESLGNLQRYYMQIMAEKGDKPVVIDVENFNLDQWVSKCFFRDDPVSSMEEYQLVAQFRGNKMLLNIPPMVVGEKAIEEMSELLSDKTIDEMNGFKSRFLGPDPAIEELFAGKKLLLI